MATTGALSAMGVGKDGKINVSHPTMSTELLTTLEGNLMLFYTGAARDAASILHKQDGATKNKERNVVSSLHEIKDIGIEIRDSIVRGNLRRFGELMDIHWKTKKRLSDGISN